MKISYFQVMDYPSLYPEDLGKRKFSSFEKCSEAAKDIKNRYPALFDNSSFRLNFFIKRFELELE